MATRSSSSSTRIPTSLKRPLHHTEKGEHIEFINLHELYGKGCLGVGTEGALAKRLAEAAAKESANGIQPQHSVVVKRIMADLELMFNSNDDNASVGGRLPLPTIVVHSDWATSPRFQGGYSHHRVDNTHEHAEFSYPINHKLFFAGEHCSEDHYGSMHGAWFSGETAALAVAASVRTVVWLQFGAAAVVALALLWVLWRWI